METGVKDLDAIVTTRENVVKTSLAREAVDGSSEDNAITRRNKIRMGRIYNSFIPFSMFFVTFV